MRAFLLLISIIHAIVASEIYDEYYPLYSKRCSRFDVAVLPVVREKGMECECLHDALNTAFLRLASLETGLPECSYSFIEALFQSQAVQSQFHHGDTLIMTCMVGDARIFRRLMQCTALSVFAKRNIGPITMAVKAGHFHIAQELVPLVEPLDEVMGPLLAQALKQGDGNMYLLLLEWARSSSTVSLPLWLQGYSLGMASGFSLHARLFRSLLTDLSQMADMERIAVQCKLSLLQKALTLVRFIQHTGQTGPFWLPQDLRQHLLTCILELEASK